MLTDPDHQKRLHFAGLTEDVRQRLSKVAPLLAPELPRIVKNFFARHREWQDLRGFSIDAGAVARLKDEQLEHFRRLLSGEFDDSYFEAAEELGRNHYRAGLNSDWYLAAYGLMLSQLNKRVLKEFWWRPWRIRPVLMALNHAVFFDLEFATRAYVHWGRRELHNELLQLADVLEELVEIGVGRVTEDSERTRENAIEMQAAAERSGEKSTTVASASEEATANVDTVAHAAQEFATSAQEIGRQTALSKSVTEKAVARASEATQVMRGLAGHAEEIGAIVQVISEIAAQTNMLSLNATIEASRAGEAGRGFAVVAGEVKSLAIQTADATTEISRQIGSMQDTTTTAVEAIEKISEIIRELDCVADAIDGAAGQQRDASEEISNSIIEAAAGNREVSRNIQDVAQNAISVSEMAKSVQEAVDSTSRSLLEFVGRVSDILVQLRNNNAANRRKHRRYPVPPGTMLELEHEGRRERLAIVNISQGGAMTAASTLELKQCDFVRLTIDGLDEPIDAVVRDANEENLRLQFELSARGRKNMLRLVAGLPIEKVAA